MDAAKPAGKKAEPPATDAQLQAVETPSSPPERDDDAAVAGEEEDDDDEQVERFYALLDNIRAMRGMLGSTGGSGTAAAVAAGRRKRRAREGAEAPWRPAFRMEDFEVVDEAGSDSADGQRPKEKKGKIDDRRESS